MSSIASGTTTTTALVYSADTSGVLQFQTNGTTAALTIDTSQRVGIGISSPNATLNVQDSTANNGTIWLGGGTYYSTIKNDATVTGALLFNVATANGGATTYQWQKGGTSQMVLDTSGNLGLGVTPSAWASGTYALQLKGGAIYNNGAQDLRIGSNVYIGSGNQYITTGAASFYEQSGGVHNWQVASSGSAGNAITFTQAMTLDNSGNLLIGVTSSTNTPVSGISTYNTSSATQIGIGHASGTGSGTGYIVFNYNASVIGSITQSGTTAVLYNTTSDYRLKSNVQPVTSGLSVINQLNPVNFTWISDNETDTGFLAHEFQAVIPRSVTGEKDATKTEEYEITPAVKDENGNVTTPAVMGTRTVPVYQQMDNSGAVPYLVAAIKELSAEVTALKAKIGV